MTQEQISKLLKEIYERLNAFVYTVTLNNFDKDDIVQASMEIIYSRCHQLRDDDKVFGWAFSIAKDQARKFYSERNKLVKPCGSGAEVVELVGDKDINDLLTEVISIREFREFMLECISCLDIKSQQIIYLRHYYDLSLKEIADITGINLNTVKTSYYRGLKQLRKNLEKKEGASVGK